MRPGSALSVAIHTSILVSGLVKPPAPTPEDIHTEIIPVALVTLEDITPVLKPAIAPGLKPTPPRPPKTEEVLPANEEAVARKAARSRAVEESRARLEARLESILKSVEKKKKPPQETASRDADPEKTEEDRIQVASIQALVKARIERDCWRDPSDMRNAETLFASIVFSLTPDGALANTPRLVQPRNMPTDPALRIFVERAFRAIQKCAPYDYLPRDKHVVWKTLQVNFSGASQ